MSSFEHNPAEQLYSGLPTRNIAAVESYLSTDRKLSGVEAIVDGSDTIFRVNDLSDTEIDEVKAEVQELVGEAYDVFWYQEKLFVAPKE